MAMKNGKGIEEKGAGTVVISSTTHAEKLVGIADTVEDLFDRYSTNNGAIIPPDVVHKIKGYMEQLRITEDRIEGK